MINIILMTFSFLVILGIAVSYNQFARATMGEGMFLSVVSIIVLLFFSSFLGSFVYGVFSICVLGLIGGGISAIKILRRKGVVQVQQGWMIVGFLFFLYLVWLVILHNDFIQHIDEFHEWAAAVKYMLEKDKLPTGADFIGGAGHYSFATSLFYLFFQRITGYNEQNMYVASSLLVFVGLLLPFSNCKREEWKKVAMYISIMYIGLFSLYMYGSKNLYVDVPTASWAGGLAGWFINRKKRKTDIGIIISGTVMLHFFKQSSGLLMAVFVLVFMLLQKYVIEGTAVYKKNGLRKFCIFASVMCMLVIVGSVIGLGVACKIQPQNIESAETISAEQPVTAPVYEIGGIELPEKVSAMMDTVQLSKEKVIKTLSAFVRNSVGAPLSTKSNWNISFVALFLLVCMLLGIYGGMDDRKTQGNCYILYAIFTALSYCAVLYFSYIFMFAYELSINLRSGTRYFSACGIYLFIIALVLLLQDCSIKKEILRKYVTWGLLLFFVLGLNINYIPNATALDKQNVPGYKRLNRTMKQIAQIQPIIEDDEKVYLICQHKNLSDAELINAPALYYLEEQVSNYLAVPWKFTEEGSNTRLENTNELSLNDLPYLLASGGYQYVWIHTSDKYLKENLPNVLPCGGKAGRGLYRIVYENEIPVRLELVSALKAM